VVLEIINTQLIQNDILPIDPQLINAANLEEYKKNFSDNLNFSYKYKLTGLQKVTYEELRNSYYDITLLDELSTTGLKQYQINLKDEKSRPKVNDILNNLDNNFLQLNNVIKASNLPKYTQNNLQNIIEKNIPNNIKKYILINELDILATQLRFIRLPKGSTNEVLLGNRINNKVFFNNNKIVEKFIIEDPVTIEQQNSFNEYLAYANNIGMIQNQEIKNSGKLNLALSQPANQKFTSKLGVTIKEAISQKQLEALQVIDLAVDQAKSKNKGAGSDIRLGTGEGKSHLVGIIENQYGYSNDDLISITLASDKQQFTDLLQQDTLQGKLILLDERYFYANYLFKEQGSNRDIIAQETAKEEQIKTLKAKGAVVISFGASESVNKINSEIARIKDGIFLLDRQKISLQENLEELTNKKKSGEYSVNKIQDKINAANKFIQDIKSAGLVNHYITKNKAAIEKLGFKDFDNNNIIDGSERKKHFITKLTEQITELKDQKEALKTEDRSNEIKTTKNKIKDVTTEIDDKKIKLNTKKSQLADLKYRRNNLTVQKIQKSTIKTSTENDLTKQITGNIGVLSAKERVQYIIPDQKFAKQEYLANNLQNILAETQADMIIFPIIENNQKYVQIYEDNKLGDKILESTLKNHFIEKPLAEKKIISIFDKTNAIGGDYAGASTNITRQITNLEATNQVNLNVLMQYDRNRTPLAERENFSLEYILPENSTLNQQSLINLAQENSRIDDLQHNIGYFSAKLANYIKDDKKNDFQKKLTNLVEKDNPLLWSLDDIGDSFSQDDFNNFIKDSEGKESVISQFKRDLKHYILHQKNLPDIGDDSDILSLSNNITPDVIKNLSFNQLKLICQKQEKEIVILPNLDKDNNLLGNLIYKYEDGNLLAHSSQLYDKDELAEFLKREPQKNNNLLNLTPNSQFEANIEQQKQQEELEKQKKPQNNNIISLKSLSEKLLKHNILASLKDFKSKFKEKELEEKKQEEQKQQEEQKKQQEEQKQQEERKKQKNVNIADKQNFPSQQRKENIYEVSQAKPDKSINHLNEMLDKLQQKKAITKQKNSIFCDIIVKKNEQGQEQKFVVIKPQIWDLLFPQGLDTTEIKGRKADLTKILNNSSDADKQISLNDFLFNKIGDFLRLDNTRNIIGFTPLDDHLAGVNNQKDQKVESSNITYNGLPSEEKQQQKQQGI
jgi:hypothetical protein